MNRLFMVSGSVLALAFVVAAQEGCSSSDSSGGTTSTPSAGAGNNTSSAGAANTAGGAPSTSGGAPTSGAGAATTAGAPSAGGASGGAPAGGATSSGGSSAAGAPAAAGAGGATTAAGAGGTTSSAGATSMPTTACTTEKKGDACTAGAGCAKTCGVKGQGATKSETCGPALTLVEGMCTYPAGTYTCYAKPATVPVCAGADATTMAVTSGAACTAADCMPCGPYADSTGAVKVGGLCTCTGGKWTCASATEWPPQG